MTTYQTQSTLITAEQWCADAPSLRRVQALIFPLSPLRAVLGSSPEPSTSLGVPAAAGGSMSWCEKGSWVVRYPTGRIAVMTDAEFQVAYVPAGGVANGGAAGVVVQSLADA